MIVLLCMILQATAPAVSGSRVEGKNRPRFEIPRLESEVAVDGVLDEPVWQRATRLTGFSQYRPVDGRPAEEETEVLVWYSPSALYFAILAHDSRPETIRATVADRDNLDRDDTVTLYLDTFNDRRRAFFFAVNPLGVQQDGVQTEGGFNPGSFIGGTVDKNPDYRWDSRGRLTGEGYTVEIRIPFKSLRYPIDSTGGWGINILRKIQRTGYEDTWTDARRASASFLTQSGTLAGLHDVRRGIVTEVQPFITMEANGARAGDGTFDRENPELNPGVNLRLGFTNLSLDATVNPDFSQVESDAGLVTVNERFRLFYPEKRPFFLEGIELFATPNQLVYTRQIVDPIAGGKLTGKFGRYGIAYLSAVDQAGEHDAVFNIARLRRDFGTDSVAGITYTDRFSDGSFNRVLAADMRLVFKKLYFFQFQIGRAWSSTAGDKASSPLWSAQIDRTGRAWGFNYSLNGIGKEFEAQSGFVPRANIVEAHAFNRFSLYGERGALLENFTIFFGPVRTWSHEAFGRDPALEGSDSATLLFQLRGGWSLNINPSRSFYRFEQERYREYEVSKADGSTIPFRPQAEASGLYGIDMSVSTPTYRKFNGRFQVKRSGAPIFDEAARGRETRVTIGLGSRPTETLRADLSGTIAHLTRSRDGSEFARTVIPRLKIEYQPRRSVFVRLIGEYLSQRQSALKDPSTGERLLVAGTPSSRRDQNGLRLDLLFSYEPTPGTVFYAGYGSSLESRRTLGLSDLRRERDGIFIKLAYLFRR